jgi:hypothetical protein
VSIPSRKPTPAREDRGEHKLLAGDLGRLHRRDGRVDLHGLQGQVAGHLVGEQHADLVEELAKALRRAPLVAHEGQLVLHQRVIDDGDAFHAQAPVPVVAAIAATLDQVAGRREAGASTSNPLFPSC